ncbi:MAG: bacteriohemerythrin [Pseudomonadota bacterium]
MLAPRPSHGAVSSFDPYQQSSARRVQDFPTRLRNSEAGVKAQGHLIWSGAICMEQIVWTDDLRTGNALIDGDHRKLISLVNALCAAMAKAQANGSMSKAMNDLIVYSKEHFGREEAEMERIQYVASIAHVSEHAKLIKQIVELKAMLDAGGRINVVAVASFLREWLCKHILTADMKLAIALRTQTPTA